MAEVHYPRLAHWVKAACKLQRMKVEWCQELAQFLSGGILDIKPSPSRYPDLGLEMDFCWLFLQLAC